MKYKLFHVLALAGVSATLLSYSLTGIQTNRVNASAATGTAAPTSATTPASTAAVAPIACVVATPAATMAAVSSGTPSTAALTPIPLVEYSLLTDAPHVFIYAGVKFTITKAVISNRNASGVIVANGGSVALTVTAENSTGYVARLDDVTLQIQLHDCQTFSLPLANITSLNTVTFKLNAAVQNVMTWADASLALVETDKEPLVLSLNAGHAPSLYPITLTAGKAADGVDKNGYQFTFKVKQATLNLDGATESASVRADVDMQYVKLTVNILFVAGPASGLVSADDFRIYADDVPYSSAFSTESTALELQANMDLTLWFSVPLGAKSLYLAAFPDGSQPVKIALNLP